MGGGVQPTHHTELQDHMTESVWPVNNEQDGIKANIPTNYGGVSVWSQLLQIQVCLVKLASSQVALWMLVGWFTTFVLNEIFTQLLDGLL